MSIAEHLISTNTPESDRIITIRYSPSTDAVPYSALYTTMTLLTYITKIYRSFDLCVCKHIQSICVAHIECDSICHKLYMTHIHPIYIISNAKRTLANSHTLVNSGSEQGMCSVEKRETNKYRKEKNNTNTNSSLHPKGRIYSCNDKKKTQR